MNVADLIFWGWYKILDNTIYINRTEDDGFGPREHSFLLAFLVHAINIWTFFRFIIAKYFLASVPLSLSVTLVIGVFAIGYLSYIRSGRWNKIVTYTTSTSKTILVVALCMTYAIVSVYFMIQAGYYVREHITPIIVTGLRDVDLFC